MCYSGILVPLGTRYLADRIGLLPAMITLVLGLTAILIILSFTSRLLNYNYGENDA